MSAALDAVEAWVCAYNEAANIGPCIDAIRASGIDAVHVVDGGSTDDTAALAKAAGAMVWPAPKGLASQRQVAIDRCGKPFLLFVDADDRLDPACAGQLLRQMLQEGYDALQARLRVQCPRSFCQRGMDALLELCICVPGPCAMVGRPALYRLDALRAVGMDTRFDGVGNEDAALSIRMERAGRKQGVGHGLSRRTHPETLGRNLAAWRKYGRGDAMLLRQYPERWPNVIGHLLFNYPVRRGFRLLRDGRIIGAAYAVLAGLARFAAMCHDLMHDARPDTGRSR